MSLKQTSTGEPTKFAAARGKSLLQRSLSNEEQPNLRPVVQQLTQNINTFSNNAKTEFLNQLSTNEYLNAHHWLQSTCKKYFNEINFAMETSKSFTDLQHLQHLQQQMIQLSRTVGPPPLPLESSSNFICRHVPADNSCLFHCINKIYNSKQQTIPTTQDIRQQCIQYVNINKTELSMTAGEEFVAEYAQLMGQDTTWGGAFEIYIQVELRQVRIVLFDVINKNEQTFNPSNGMEPLTVAYLVRVDGNHFDYLAWCDPSRNTADRNVFSIYDACARRRARRAARELSTTEQRNEDWRVEGSITKKPMLRQTSWQ